MATSAAWRKYMTLVPEDASVASGAQSILSGGSLKRRRQHDAQEANQKNAKQKLTEENIIESPLLKLPAEIRRLILQYAVGGHHIHIEQLPVGHAIRYEKKDIKFGQGLWNELCHEDDAEAQAYQKFQEAKMGEEAADTPYVKTRDGEDTGKGYYVPSSTFRHRQCANQPGLHRFNVALEEWKARPALSLRCLRTCKVIYKEARTLAYSSNTFLFGGPLAFQTFAASVRPEQLWALHYINLSVAIGSAPFSEGRARLWTSILWDYKLTKCIRNLKILTVTVELYFPRDAFENRPRPLQKPVFADCLEEINVSSDPSASVLKNWLQLIARLSRQTPTFKVIVADDAMSPWGELGSKLFIADYRIRDLRVWMAERNAKCLTIEGKQTLAIELEKRLLAEAGN